MVAPYQASAPSPPQSVVDNLVGGDLNVAGRDNIITAYLTGLQRLRPRPVDPDRAMPAERFVKPGSFDMAVRAVSPPSLSSTVARIVVLRAPEGYGRRSAALRVLASTSVPQDRFFELLPDWDTPDVASLPEERNAGYLLNLRGVSQSLPDQFFVDLIAYADRLRERGSYLVVTANSTVWTRAWADGLRLGVLVVDLGLPSPTDIVRTFLLSRPHTASRESWVDDSNSSFFGILPKNSSPGEAVRLAELIARAEGPRDEERLDEYHGWRDRLGQWFGGGSGDVEVRAIRISGALLNGAPGSVILDSADLLLRAPEINVPPREGGLLARPDARGRLKPAGITFDSKTGTARLIHDSQGSAILEYLWKEHTQLSQVLTRWLQDISRGPAQGDLKVLASSLTKLAEMVGVAPILDLAESWLLQGNDKSIDLVSDLISDLAIHPVLGGSVRIELTKWANGKSQPSRQRAVARAISGRFGRTYSSQALTRARYLVNSPGTPQVRKDVIKSIRDLAATVDLSALAVDTVVKWITPLEGRAASVEAGVFLDVFSPPSSNQPELSPLQVALAQGGPAGQAIRKRLVDGWLQVVRSDTHRGTAADRLLRWRRAAEDDQLPQGVVVDTIIQLGRAIGPFESPVREVIKPDGRLKDTLLNALFAEIETVYGPTSSDSSVASPESEAIEASEISTNGDGHA